MTWLDDLMVPVKIREPLEVTTIPSRQHVRHLQINSTADQEPFILTVPTGTSWILRTLMIQYNPSNKYGNRSIAVNFATPTNPAMQYFYAVSALVGRSQNLVMTMLPGVGSSDTLMNAQYLPYVMVCIRPMPTIMVANQTLNVIPFNTNLGEAITIDLDFVEVSDNG